MTDTIFFTISERQLKTNGKLYSGETVYIQVPAFEGLTVANYKFVIYGRDKHTLALSDAFTATEDGKYWTASIATNTEPLAELFEDVRANQIITVGSVILNTETSDTIAQGLLDIVSVPFPDDLIPVPQPMHFITDSELDEILSGYTTSSQTNVVMEAAMNAQGMANVAQGTANQALAQAMSATSLASQKQDQITSNGILNADGSGNVGAITVGSGLTYIDGILSASEEFVTDSELETILSGYTTKEELQAVNEAVETAQDTAAAAQVTADDAYSTSTTAEATAETAENTAQNAMEQAMSAQGMANVAQGTANDAMAQAMLATSLATQKQDQITSNGILNCDGNGNVGAITVGSGLTYIDGTLSASAQSQIATRNIMYANQKAPIYINHGQASQTQIGSVIEFAGWDQKNYVWMEDITSTTVDRSSGFVVGVYLDADHIAGLLPESFAGFHPVIMSKTKAWGRNRKLAYIVKKLESGCIELDATSSGGVIDLSVGTYTLNFYNESFPWASYTSKNTPILTAQFDKSWSGTHPDTLSHPIEQYNGGVKYGSTNIGPWIASDIDSYYKYYLVPQCDEKLNAKQNLLTNTANATGAVYIDDFTDPSKPKIGVKYDQATIIANSADPILMVNPELVQMKLTAGENITISDNFVISASGGGGGHNFVFAGELLEQNFSLTLYFADNTSQTYTPPPNTGNLNIIENNVVGYMIKNTMPISVAMIPSNDTNSGYSTKSINGNTYIFGGHYVNTTHATSWGLTVGNVYSIMTDTMLIWEGDR